MKVATVIIVVWLLVGALAAGQRHYYGGSSKPSCTRVSTVAVTIVAGPLNYVGVNPKIHCEAPKPSK